MGNSTNYELKALRRAYSISSTSWECEFGTLPASDNQVESERNLINFRQAIETYVRREYGDIANIFTLMEYPEYPEVDYDPEELTKQRDPFGLKKNEVKKLLIIRLEKQEKLESDKPKV